MTKAELEEELKDMKRKLLLALGNNGLCYLCQHNNLICGNPVCSRCDNYYSEFKECANEKSVV